MASDDSLTEELQSLQKKLGKKNSFEEAVSSIESLVRDRYVSSSLFLRRSMYSTVCRVATVFQTRYKASGFWLAGLRLFEQVQGLVSESSEKEHLKKCIARAREHLNEIENDVPVSERQPGNWCTAIETYSGVKRSQLQIFTVINVTEEVIARLGSETECAVCRENPC